MEAKPQSVAEQQRNLDVLKRLLHNSTPLAEGQVNYLSGVLVNRSVLTIREGRLDKSLEQLGQVASEDVKAALFEQGVLSVDTSVRANKDGHMLRISPRGDSATGAGGAGAEGGTGDAGGAADEELFRTEALNQAVESCASLSSEHREALAAIDDWLCELDGAEPVPASVRQRSYEVFGREKALEESGDALKKFLKKANVWDLLAIETFQTGLNRSYVLHGTRSPILVVENMDTYQTVRRYLRAAGASNPKLLGARVGGVLFGNGNLSASPGWLDRELVQMGYRCRYVLYAGDIDPAGVQTVVRARENNGIEIRLHRRLYAAMLAKQRSYIKQRGRYPEQAPGQHYTYELEAIAREIPVFQRLLFLQTLRQNQRIPQEILSLRDLHA